jgi:hypothetical protein
MSLLNYLPLALTQVVADYLSLDEWRFIEVNPHCRTNWLKTNDIIETDSSTEYRTRNLHNGESICIGDMPSSVLMYQDDTGPFYYAFWPQKHIMVQIHKCGKWVQQIMTIQDKNFVKSTTYICHAIKECPGNIFHSVGLIDPNTISIHQIIPIITVKLPITGPNDMANNTLDFMHTYVATIDGIRRAWFIPALPKLAITITEIPLIDMIT